MENIIKVEDVTFYYKMEDEPVEALKNVNINVEKGKFIAILGRNGSGKSTLAKTLNGLLLPFEGKVFVAGFDTVDDEAIWDIREIAGMVFQNPDNQLVSSIVEEDVAFGPENLGLDSEEIRKRVESSLKAVDMWEFREKAPHMLSGGQKQRIAIAGVLAMKPSCIIFDEPTAMLDPEGRREVLKIIRTLNNQGVTVILVTHFMEEASQSDELLVMDRGEVVLRGEPRNILCKGKEIEKMGLEVPIAVKLGESLRNKGIDVPDNIIDIEEMVEFLCQYK